MQSTEITPVFQYNIFRKKIITQYFSRKNVVYSMTVMQTVFCHFRFHTVCRPVKDGEEEEGKFTIGRVTL
jgi:hypothetical protein